MWHPLVSISTKKTIHQHEASYKHLFSFLTDFGGREKCSYTVSYLEISHHGYRCHGLHDLIRPHMLIKGCCYKVHIWDCEVDYGGALHSTIQNGDNASNISLNLVSCLLEIHSHPQVETLIYIWPLDPMFDVKSLTLIWYRNWVWAKKVFFNSIIQVCCRVSLLLGLPSSSP